MGDGKGQCRGQDGKAGTGEPQGAWGAWRACRAGPVPYQGRGDPGVEAQQAHVPFHAAVHHQRGLPPGLPYQLPVDCEGRGAHVGRVGHQAAKTPRLAPLAPLPTQILPAFGLVLGGLTLVHGAQGARRTPQGRSPDRTGVCREGGGKGSRSAPQALCKVEGQIFRARTPSTCHTEEPPRRPVSPEVRRSLLCQAPPTEASPPSCITLGEGAGQQGLPVSPQEP